MSYATVLKESRQRMEKAMSHTQDQLRNIRTSRASAGLVENIRVEYYGTPTPMNQLAQISVPEPRQLVIKPFDPSAIEEIGKAIMKSDLGVSPENDGKVVRLNMPALSGDQRKKYAARAKELGEEGRVALRNIRRDANKEADALTKKGEITEDENHKLHEEIQELLKEMEGKVADVTEKKINEILEV